MRPKRGQKRKRDRFQGSGCPQAFDAGRGGRVEKARKPFCLVRYYETSLKIAQELVYRATGAGYEPNFKRFPDGGRDVPPFWCSLWEQSIGAKRCACAKCSDCAGQYCCVGTQAAGYAGGFFLAHRAVGGEARP